MKVPCILQLARKKKNKNEVRFPKETHLPLPKSQVWYPWTQPPVEQVRSECCLFFNFTDFFSFILRSPGWTVTVLPAVNLGEIVSHFWGGSGTAAVPHWGKTSAQLGIPGSRANPGEQALGQTLLNGAGKMSAMTSKGWRHSDNIAWELREILVAYLQSVKNPVKNQLKKSRNSVMAIFCL